MTRRVGILGGTFDPIHRGHVDLGVEAQSALDLTSLLVIPSNVPPHRPAPTASSFHRFAMVALAVAGRPGWQASDIELCEEAQSYTSTTLRRLNERGYEPGELVFVIGADAFADIGSWKDFPGILEGAHFAVVSRPGWPVDRLRQTLAALSPRMRTKGDWLERAGPWIILIDAHTSNVSATAIRGRCAEGLSVADMVPPGVRQHLEQHGLYTSTASDRRGRDRLTNPAAGRLHGQS
jgi:nicotinate-nucleotide adenylyltransferase